MIGHAREPKEEDRNMVPFMNTIIHKIQRIIDAVPSGCIRSTTWDVDFHGYRIPKVKELGIMHL